jgi:hypothetical protein
VQHGAANIDVLTIPLFYHSMQKCAILLWSAMCRFLKFIPSPEAFWLLHNKPNAFRLLTHIANTARRTHSNHDGLTIGQCHLQHWTTYNLTEREYRTAKDVLVSLKHIKIIDTNRTRQKSTTGTTTRSTLVEICSTTIYDINSETNDDIKDDRTTTERRQTRKNKNEEEEEYKDIAQSAPRRRKKDSLSFDFETWKFVGITQEDREDWKLMYPLISLEIEIIAAAHWLKDNPSKSNRTLWRRYLNGWLKRNNEWAANKKAYQSGKGGFQGTDRRTKDVEGNPVENQYKGKF